MEDLHVDELEVVDIEVVIMLHRPVEGETEGQGVHVAGTVSHAAADHRIVAGELGNLGVVVRVDHVEELEHLAALLAARQHHTVGHAAMGLRLVELELVVAVGGVHQLLVELQVGGAIVHPEGEVTAGALDVVNARLQMHLEVLQLEEVLVVVLQWDLVSVLIVLGSNEDLDHGILRLVRGHVQGELEGLVVETLLAGLDHIAGSLVVGVPAEGVQRIGGSLNGGLHIDGIADVRVEVLEVGGQALGHVDGIDVDTLEGVVLLVVLRIGLHQMPVVADNGLVHLVEDGIAHGGVVVHERAGEALVAMAVVVALVHNEAVQLVQTAVELLVHAVRIALDDVAQHIDGLHIELLVLVDPVHHALRVNLHVLDMLVVVLVVEAVVVLPVPLGHAVVGAQVAGIAGFGRHIHVESGHLAEIVGQTLQVPTGQQLPVDVQVELTATILVEDMLLAALRPERIVQVEVVVEGIEANILQVVGQIVIVVQGAVHVRVVRTDHHVVDVVHLLDMIEAVHLVVLSPFQCLAIEVAPWVDLVVGRQDDSLHIITEQTGNGHGVHEQLLVHVLAGPEDGVLEGLPVLGEVEETHQTHHILLVLVVHHRPHHVIGEGLVLPQLEEVLQHLRVHIVGHVLPRLVLHVAASEWGGEHIGLVDVLQDVEHELLLHQKVLVRHLGVQVLGLAESSQQCHRSYRNHRERLHLLESIRIVMLQ
ncbi:GM19389 [Drosophila sechellia]|uniref:GM19389 n=1 Tax=Drosophila sechellia TaxID=7238 RepID=B4HFI7_DROSE|nr:GM19389 [Drosophila sechellia]